MVMEGKKMVVRLAIMVMAVSFWGKWVSAQTHHVVGGDRGWDISSDVASWSDGRVFRVRDKLWFSYSAAQESIVELGSKYEFYTCDVSNPIRMYTDGLNAISLDEEGIRYFTSSKPESCKNGLKLHVDVIPHQKPGIKQVISSDGQDELRIHAEEAMPKRNPVIKQVTTSDGSASTTSSDGLVADGPTTPEPSGSTSVRFNFVLVWAGFGFLFMGFY